MIKKIFASAFIVFYILCLPLQSYSLNAQQRNYNKVMKLNASGAAKVAARIPIIARGLWAAGAWKALPYIGTAITVGILIYSAIEFYRDWTKIDIPPVTDPLPLLPSLTDPTLAPSQWGRQEGWPVVVERYTWTGGGSPVCEATYVRYPGVWEKTFSGYLPDNYYAIGGYTEIIGLRTCLSDTYAQSKSVYLFALPFPPLPITDATKVDEGEEISVVPDANRLQIEADLEAARAGLEAMAIANPSAEPIVRPLIRVIVAARDALKPVELAPGDYTITPGIVPVENTYEPGTDPAVFPSDIPIEEPIPDVPPVIPDNACFEYQRRKHFDYSSLLQSAQAVPLLGLLSKLVINPAAGQFNGKVTFQLSKFGTQEIDLNKWHYSDAIAIFRFVIIGGAFLTAIRIIYD